ncbi:phosphoglycerate kinase [Micractinium conductrix]|uniref:Phosphoglycerate kinase n=1 Tax=Micractinium conductrix TaxID=554055 RepID=A0A2P6VCX3_9CHLO|nr:phosphoglycerate kinase [Micractinium conductrix]|eukprot:PSC71938.1 phosphoglycerate kinase [Micractinium conductrix]
MEAFMLKTGFYEKVTQLEAQQLEEGREEREARMAEFRAELERQAAERGVKLRLPPAPGSSSSGAGAGGNAGGGSSVERQRQ